MGRAYLSSFLFARSEGEDRYVGTQILDWRISPPEFISLDGKSDLPSGLDQRVLTSESDVFAFGTTVMEVRRLHLSCCYMFEYVFATKRLSHLEHHCHTIEIL